MIRKTMAAAVMSTTLSVGLVVGVPTAFGDARAIATAFSSTTFGNTADAITATAGKASDTQEAAGTASAGPAPVAQAPGSKAAAGEASAAAPLASGTETASPSATIAQASAGTKAAPGWRVTPKTPTVSAAGQRGLSSSQVFAGGLYVDQDTDAARAATRAAAGGRTTDAALLREIGSQASAVWLGDWNPRDQLAGLITRHLTAAKATGTTPVFVTYAVPNRDCGGYSAGGLSETAYQDWNRTIADTLRGSGAVVLVEPDSLAQLSNCPQDETRRTSILLTAVKTFTGAGLVTYLDAGHSNWVSADVMATRLTAAGVGLARGFVTNVSNFQRVEDERRYADALSAKLGGAFYVIDVSRNGAGWTGDWCNPVGAALGQSPQVSTGTTKLDALLWVKRPGESDGTCNGGPSAGSWWDAYALDLVRNRR